MVENPGGVGGPRRSSGMEIPGEEGGAKQKAFRGGVMDIFWNYRMPNSGHGV